MEANIDVNPMYENRPRYAGILLHITALPGPYGIGDLGSAARSFADFLFDAGISLWQLLPLGPTGFGNSPYAARSSFAGNELLISPELLAADGLLGETELAELQDKIAQTKTDDKVNRVNFGSIETLKLPILEKAAHRFAARYAKSGNSDFDDFCSREAYWLDDYAVFHVLYEEHFDARWHTVWDKKIAKREKDALDKVQKEKAKEILECKILQYFFERQWQDLRTYVNGKGIKIIGDIPIYAAPDSADTWSRIDLFNLSLVSGVPPDYFSATGQLWGNPVYDWDRNKAEKYNWWTDRIRRLLAFVDIFRIDHFRGFDEYWAVPAGNLTAEFGTWEPGPGKDLFITLEKNLGKLPIIAEDLGFLTESVVKLKDDLGFPGMKICQFGFEDMKDGVIKAGHLFLPHNFSYPWAAYTGTHDNDTTAAWYSKLDKKNRRMVAAYLNCNKDASPADIAWAMVRAIASSHAQYAIFPLQDLLGLGEEARFNTPSTCNNENWSWRLWEIPGAELADRVAFMMALFGRH